MRKIKIMFLVISIVVILCIIATLIAANYFYNLALDPKTNKEIVDKGNVTQEVEASKNDAFNYRQWLLTESDPIEFYVTSRDGLQLHNYEINTLIKSHKYAIVVHGYTSSAKSMGRMAKYFFDRGYHVILPDLRGHGQSEGDYIGMGWHERNDLIDLIDSIIARDETARIVLAGVSMGAASVLMVSGEELPDQVAAIVADSSYTSVWEEFSFELSSLFHIPEFPIIPATSLLTKYRAGYDFKEASAIEQVKKSKTPTLFIHGNKDTFVPPYMVEQLYEACSAKKEKLIVEGAGHAQSFEVAPELYKVKVSGFLNKYHM
ncbi:MAG: alpha/beta hydrolase [bacterium]|nr:alpha/beta hydrolase [bacterium]